VVVDPSNGSGQAATGLLVPIEQASDGTGTPLDPDQYVADFAAALESVLADPERAQEMGRAGRRRAIESFAWSSIAERTRAIYEALA
jgi:starch synthase